MRIIIGILTLMWSSFYSIAQNKNCTEHFSTAYEFFKLHDFKNCIPYFLQAEKCGIKNEALYFSLGRAYLATEKYDSSIYYLNICDSVYHSDYFWTYGNRGIAYAQIKQYDKARRDLNQAINKYEKHIVHLGSDGWLLYRERAWLNIATDSLEAAEVDFHLAIEENPDTVMNYVELCELYGMMGQYQHILDQQKNIEDFCRDDGHRTIYAFYRMFAKMMLQQPITEDEQKLKEFLTRPFHIIWYFDEFNLRLAGKKLTNQQLQALYAWEEKIKMKK